MRYSPKGADDIHDCVVMICQACGLDKKHREQSSRCFLSRGYEKDIFGELPLGFELQRGMRSTRKSRAFSSEIEICQFSSLSFLLIIIILFTVIILFCEPTENIAIKIKYYLITNGNVKIALFIERNFK